MQYLCEKQLTAGEVTFHPGQIIPDGVILPERSGKLIKSGYISALNGMEHLSSCPDEELFTQEQVEKMVAEAVDEAVNNTVLEMEQKQKELQAAAGVLQEESFLSEGTVIIPVKRVSDGDNEQQTAVPATPEEIQQVFSILQMNAEEGSREISNVKSENVLILLHAADSRKTIKDAARKQADKLFPAEDVTNELVEDNTAAGTDTEGAGA